MQATEQNPNLRFFHVEQCEPYDAHGGLPARLALTDRKCRLTMPHATFDDVVADGRRRNPRGLWPLVKPRSTAFVYLAGRYSRRVRLLRCAEQIDEVPGLKVQARWLAGDHQIGDRGSPIGEQGEALVEAGGDGAAALREKFALDDLQDVHAADLLVAFTEPLRSVASRGGRHVELGFALALQIPILVCGPRENLFCWLPHVDAVPDWPSARRWIDEWAQENSPRGRAGPRGL